MRHRKGLLLCRPALWLPGFCRLLLAAGLITGLAACNDTPNPQATPNSNLPRTSAKTSALLLRKPVDAGIWTQANSHLQHTLSEAAVLDSLLKALLAAPTVEALAAAQQQWQQVQQHYEQFFAYAWLGTSSSELIDSISHLHSRAAAWPIEPGFLDRFGSYAYSGLIFDISTPMEAPALRAQHQLTRDEEVVTGVYALHFLLFGEDGTRSAADFIAREGLSNADLDRGYETPAELPENRRRMLLKLQSELLLEDLELLNHVWLSAPVQKEMHAQDTANLNRKAVTLFAHNLAAVAELHSKQAELTNFPSRELQLADRLRWHTQVWQQLLPDAGFDKPEPVQELGDKVLNALQATGGQTGGGEAPGTQYDWPAIYRAVTDLAQYLQLARAYD